MIVEYLVKKPLATRKTATVSLIKNKSCTSLSRMLLAYNHSYLITACLALGRRKKNVRIK
jgi:hypothetical protein